MKEALIFMAVLFLVPVITHSQDEPAMLSQTEIDEMLSALDEDSLLAQYIEWLGGDPEALYENFKGALHNADSAFEHDQERLAPFSDLGTTRHFEMLPLVDWFTGSDSLVGEAGVSYLIRTDNATILFDVGRNAEDRDPSPLLANMERLGVSIDDIDVIVISHPHGDHVGGGKWARTNTFSLTAHQLDLGQKKVFTPIPMNYPGLEPIHASQPTKIAEGVATIGVISCPMFHGVAQEQAIAVNLDGKGIVIVSGCGHQTIGKILARAECLFDEPLYGMLGGFHLPVSEGRNITKEYQYFVTSRLPWKPLSAEDISSDIALLKGAGVKVVGISGHDSCDLSIGMFREAFGESYVEIAVGDKITLDR